MASPSGSSGGGPWDGRPSPPPSRGAPAGRAALRVLRALCPGQVGGKGSGDLSGGAWCVWGGPPSSVPSRLLSPPRDPNLFLLAPPIGRRWPQPVGPSPIPISIDRHQVQLDPRSGSSSSKADSAPPGPWTLESDGHTGQHPGSGPPTDRSTVPYTRIRTPTQEMRRHPGTKDPPQRSGSPTKG